MHLGNAWPSKGCISRLVAQNTHSHMSTLITLHRICSKAECPILIFFFLHFGQRWWNQQANTGVSGISTLLTLSLPLRSQYTASVPRAARALVVVDIGLGIQIFNGWQGRVRAKP